MFVPGAPRALLPSAQSLRVNLTAGDVALIMGGSGVPTPTQQYADTAADLYLQPNGFASTPEAPTPERFIDGRAPADIAAALYHLQPNGFGSTTDVLTTPELFTDREWSETQG